MSGPKPTPAMIHQFDQDLAAINNTLNNAVTAYHAAKQIYSHQEILMALATALHQKDFTDGESLAQHLAVAISRIAELEEGIKQIMAGNYTATTPTGNYSSASNSEPPQPTSDQ